MAKSKVVVDIIAPNARTFNMLEFVLQQHGKGRFELGRGSRPDLVVVDIDRPDDKAALKKYRSRFPDVPAVLLLNPSVGHDQPVAEDRVAAEFVLPKPFAARDFIAKIDECVRSSDAATAKSVVADGKSGYPAKDDAPELLRRDQPEAGAEKTITLQTSRGNYHEAHPAMRQRSWEKLENDAVAYPFAFDADINMADEAAVKSRWLKIDKRFLAYFKRAALQQKNSQSALCLSVGGKSSFHLSPYARMVAVTGEPVDLQALAGQELDEQEITVRECAMPEGKMQLQFTTEAFLWKLALYTYRGFLPEGTDVNKPVYLMYWPNLTRLEPTPDAMRISALLSRQPVSLAFIVRILNLPQKHVFNFYSAANAIAFAGPAVREVDNMFLPSYPDELAKYQAQETPGNTLQQGART